MVEYCYYSERKQLTMKFLNKPFTALLIGVLSLLVLSACGAEAKTESGVQSQTIQENGTPSEFVPADSGVLPRDGYTLPYLGLNVTLPQELQSAMLDKTLYMGADESLSADGTAVEYALLTWSALTEEQKNETIAYDAEIFSAWQQGLSRAAVLGVYDEAHVQELDALTGLTTHQLLGQAGPLSCYLSTDPAAETAPLFASLGVKIYEPSPLISGDSAFTIRKEAIKNLGSFTMTDIEGNTFTEALFAENELTMVNLFATWCSPCVREIPELEELRHNLADRDFGIVGVVLDGVDDMGNPDPKAMEKAKELAQKTGATYPFLVPDSTMMNGRLVGVTAVPETFFVDREGNIVGEVYPGAHSLADWTSIVEMELSNLRGAN